MDISFALWLRVVEEQLNLEDEGGGLVNEVFDGEDIKINTILKKLVNKVYKRKK